MPVCCPIYIETFEDAEETLIAVPADIQATSGNFPFVHLMYEIDDQVMIDNGVLTAVNYETIVGAPYVRINHGGPATGWVKLK